MPLLHGVWALQVSFAWFLPFFVILFGLYQLHWTHWDGGIAPTPFLVCKTVWINAVALSAMTINYFASTAEPTIKVVRERFNWVQNARATQLSMRETGGAMNPVSRSGKVVGALARRSIVVADALGDRMQVGVPTSAAIIGGSE